MTTGIERWTEGDLAVRLRPTAVADFPSLIAEPTNFTDYCSVEVDAAAGRLIDVQFSDGGRRPPIPQSDLCARAEVSAAEVMKSLSTQ
jgi:hypothetical protein